MTRPNKVFFISKEFNFIEYDNTLDSFVSCFLKSLVSGFGPYPVNSVKVVDKVATVDIGEPVRIYPGAKINIDGTGVTALDTWHEVDNFIGNTYTFNVDAPDGEYNNGITMGYPSLGWSLVDRKDNTFLLKNGSSGTRSRLTLISFNRSRGNLSADQKWRNAMIIEQASDSTSINTLRSVVPEKANAIGMPLLLMIGSSGEVLPSMWYFYGDDSFVLMGHRTFNREGDVLTKKANLYQCSFGELTDSPFKNGSHFLNGSYLPENVYTNDYTPQGYWIYDCGFGGYLHGNVPLDNTALISNDYNSKNNFVEKCYVRSNIFLEVNQPNYNTSGFQLSGLSERFVANNGYGMPFVYNSKKENIGTVPGVYYLFATPGMFPKFSYNESFYNKILLVESFLKPIVAEGLLRKRKVYSFYSSGYSSVGSAAPAGFTIDPTYQAITSLDLSGPIR